jgi:hypothetical protein
VSAPKVLLKNRLFNRDKIIVLVGELASVHARFRANEFADVVAARLPDESSRSGTGGGPWAGSREAATTSRRRRASSRRSRSVIRRAATAISQPLGLSGRPSTGHCCSAASSALGVP